MAHFTITGQHQTIAAIKHIHFNVMISKSQAVLLHLTLSLSCLAYCVNVFSLVHSAYTILWLCTMPAAPAVFPVLG